MSYKTLENQMKSIISNLPAGKEFCLNQIIENPPAQLGRALCETVQSGKILDVTCITTAQGCVWKYGKTNNALK